MGCESSDVVGFDLWPLLQGQMRIAILKSAYISLFIGPRGWESFGVVRFDLGPLVQGQTRITKLKSAYISLFISPRGLGW